jgi:hypothetical protein
VSTLLRRMLRASLLDSHTYEEVEADRRAIGQAALVVSLACVAIGCARAWHGVQAGFDTERLVFQVVLSVLEPLALWVGGSAFAFMVGATFLRGPATQTDFAEVLRTTGFAFSPALLRALVVLPPATLGLGIDLLARAWTFAAVVVAIRQALDFDTKRAVATFGAAALLLWLVLWGASVAPLPF